MVGFIAISKAGHDKGHTYLIVKSDDKYVYLSDGRIKKVDSPKKKKIKHIQVVKTDYSYGNNITDAVVVKGIKDFIKSTL